MRGRLYSLPARTSFSPRAPFLPRVTVGRLASARPAYVNRGPAYTARDKTSSSPGASTFSNDAAENPGASRVSR